MTCTSCGEDVPNALVEATYFMGLPAKGWEQSFIVECPECDEPYTIHPQVSVTFGLEVEPDGTPSASG